jgi:signal transduction histidine kinase
LLEQIHGGSERPELQFPGFFMLENFAPAFLEGLRSQNHPESEKILEETNAALAETFEISHRLMDMVKHFRSLEDKTPEICVPSTYSVADSVYQVLRAMQYEFPMEKISLLKIIPQDLLPSPVPRELLEVLIFHLIYNARKSLGELPGIITIEASEKKVLSAEDRGYLMVRVADTGPALTDEHMLQLFDPFFTAIHVRRINGIGLCIVKKIVEHHHGFMRVETSLMGTSYIIELPR